MSKNVLSLNSNDAKKFFLDQEAYSNIELPPYFSFGKTVSAINGKIKDNILSLADLNKAKKYETVNHVLYGNKDGKYAWRKYELINPLLYVSLVNIITQKDNWSSLQNRFKEFQLDKNIECESIPVLKRNKSKQKAAQISQWIEHIEKKSLILALEYKFLYQTDITDCYGSVYTHSIPWSIHTKQESKVKRGYDQLFGNKIDHHIQAMSCGQTNGIPQGSMLMDFIAEIVLGCADIEISTKLKKLLQGKKFHILRYRDDYKIFVNDISDGDIILKCISETLIEFGFRLNTSKTSYCADIITGSIKPDKIEVLKYGPVPKKLSKKDLMDQLMIIQQASKEFPNSGTLKNRLSKILDAVQNKNFYNQQEVITSLLIDIAYNNPNTFPVIATLVSSCISRLPLKVKKDLLVKIEEKICNLSNIGLIEIWMQRIAIKFKFKLSLKEKLCKLVYGDKEAIFITDWIDDKAIKSLIDSQSFIDKDKIGKMKTIIEKKEVQIFNTYYN